MGPRLSIVTPVFDPPPAALRTCINSVLGQADADWEWVLVDDGSRSPEVLSTLEEVGRHPRVTVVLRSENRGIVAASNDALDRLTGDYVVLLDHDDALEPGILATVLTALDSAITPVDYLYTDEAHVDLAGKVTVPFPKPPWSPERFRSSMYTCHLSVLRREAVLEVGGFRAGFDGSQDHDLVLRVTERAAARGHAVIHLPVMGYRWRTVTTSVSRSTHTLGRAVENGRLAVQEQCDRLGIEATVEHGPLEGTYRLRRVRVPGTTACVVVASELRPQKQRPNTLRALSTLNSISPEEGDNTFVIAYPADSPAELVDLLDDAIRRGWRLVPVLGEFGLAAAIDQSLTAYPADVLVSVAPGLVARPDLTPNWLDTLVGLAVSKGAGVAGGLLCDPDGTVIHAGWELPDYRSYPLEGRQAGDATVGHDLLIERETSQVSMALAALTRRQWEEARPSVRGWWHEAGATTSGALGYVGARNLWTPYARFDRCAPVSFELPG